VTTSWTVCLFASCLTASVPRRVVLAISP
jgi:hypothetical protein